MSGLGKIYKITCNDTGEVYYGSTKQPLSKRKGGHKTDVKRYDEGKITGKLSCYDIVKNNNFKMELVEEVPLENLKQREKYYIQNFKCININNPFPTKEEVRALNNENNKKHRQKRNARQKEYREKNSEIVECECGSCVKKCRFKEHLKTKKHLEFNKKK